MQAKSMGGWGRGPRDTSTHLNMTKSHPQKLENGMRTPSAGAVMASSLQVVTPVCVTNGIYVDSGQDKSVKGSLDAPIVDLVNFLNGLPDYVTTSSCSGRIALFQDLGTGVCKKSEGRWLLSSHEEVTLHDVQSALAGAQDGEGGRHVTMKQEPFIMHVECRDLPAAEKLFKIAFSAGFRESGIGLGKKILVAIRTTSNSIEAPVVLGGEEVMTGSGLGLLVDLANHKFRLNRQRTARLEQDLRAAFTSPSPPPECQPAAGEEEAPLSSLLSENGVVALPRVVVWEPMGLVGAEPLLQRWGHTLCQSGSHEAWIFGGYGYHGKQLVRLGSLVLVDLVRKRAREVQVAGPRPAAREKHAACLIKGIAGQPDVMVVFGGRAAPTSAMGDLWLLPLGGDGNNKPKSWQLVDSSTGPAPSPRWGHSMTTVGADKRKVVVYGGRDERQVFGGDYLHVGDATMSQEGEQGDSSTVKWTWTQVALIGHPSAGLSSPRPPPAVFLHSACAVTTSKGREHLFIFGGLRNLSGSTVCRGGYLADTSTGQVTAVRSEGGGRYAHTAIAIANSCVLISGGMGEDDGGSLEAGGAQSGSSRTPTLALHLKQDPTDHDDGKGVAEMAMVVSRLETHFIVPEPPMIGHQMCMTPQGVCSMGGGVQTFAFAPVFSPPHLLRLPTPLPPSPPTPPPCVDDGSLGDGTPAGNGSGVSADGGGDDDDDLAHGVPTLLVRVRDTATVKRALANACLLDKSHRIAPAAKVPPITKTAGGDQDDATLGGPIMAVPILLHAFQALLPYLPPGDASSSPLSSVVNGHVNTPPPPPAVSRFFASLPSAEPSGQGCGIILGWALENAPNSASAVYGRINQLSSIYESMAEAYHVPAALVEAAPRRLERVGDVLLLEHDAFADEPWRACHKDLWPALSRLHQTTRVARMAPIEAGTRRRSQVRLIWPPSVVSAMQESPAKEGPEAPGWVTVRENGLVYGFDLTRVMFSSGNVSEKARMGRLDCRGETVVDLYAGIGYYTIPFLVHAKAAHVIACEWNPDSLLALSYNLWANGVADRAEVLGGDNRVTTKALGDGIAHRVNLGLLPSSEETWPVAVRLLRDEGGWLHVHGNVLESALASWVERVVATVEELGQRGEGSSSSSSSSRKWEVVRCRHVEKVKSYAPRVWHVVADIECLGVPEREDTALQN